MMKRRFGRNRASPRYGRVGDDGVERSVSARKLAATLWGLNEEEWLGVVARLMWKREKMKTMGVDIRCWSSNRLQRKGNVHRFTHSLLSRSLSKFIERRIVGVPMACVAGSAAVVGLKLKTYVNESKIGKVDFV